MRWPWLPFHRPPTDLERVVALLESFGFLERSRHVLALHEGRDVPVPHLWYEVHEARWGRFIHLSNGDQQDRNVFYIAFEFDHAGKFLRHSVAWE
jgi:hypothetical protein